MKRSAGVVATALYTAVALVAATASAATAPASPIISWVHVARTSVGSFGGDVEVTAAVRGAASCTLELVSNSSLAVGYSAAPRSCTSGAFTARVVIGPNSSHVARTVSFALVARKSPVSVTDQFVVDVAARMPVTATVPPARIARVPPPMTTGTTTAASGTPTTSVFFPRPSPATTSTTATSSASTSSSTTSTTSSTTSTTSSTTTTTAQTTSSNIQGTTSGNWSGYAVVSGAYTSAQGTFTVPVLTSGAACNEELSEWVGIDGFNDSQLIQAGIGESMVGPYDNQTCTSGQYYVWGWWEVLPYSMTPVTMTVDPGDQMAVAISRLSGSNWQIVLTDTTRNETATEDETYSAPGTSAEWVVEAPYDSYVCHGYCLPEPYSPAAPFSGISYTGSTSTVYDITMRQGGANLATPSSLSQWPANFNVSYMGSQNGRFSGALRPIHRLGRAPGVWHPIYEG